MPKAKKDKIMFYGTGRRKSSIARVRLVEGTGVITINGKNIDEYLGTDTLKVIVRQPLTATNTTDKYDVICKVQGGGFTGQAGAIRLGIARALLEANNEYRPTLKSAGVLKKLEKHHNSQRDNDYISKIHKKSKVSLLSIFCMLIVLRPT